MKYKYALRKSRPTNSLYDTKLFSMYAAKNIFKDKKSQAPVPDYVNW